MNRTLRLAECFATNFMVDVGNWRSVRTPFRGCFRICGHDKSAPTAAYKLPKYCEQIGITQHSHNETRNKQSANTQLPPTKLATNTPTGVGADSSRPYPYIIKYVYSFHKIRAFVPSNTHFRSPLWV